MQASLKPSPIDFVVTGTPRSGTTYVAKVLQKLGLECRHERRFTPWDVVIESYRLNSVPWGDSSWLAAPFLHLLPPTTRVLHIVRDPLKTLNSIIGTGQIDWPDDYRTFIAKYCWNDENYWPTDVGRDAQVFWERWNLMIERSGRVTKRFKIEELPSIVPEVVSALGIPQVDGRMAAEAVETVPTTVNARKHYATVTLTRSDLTPECVEMARRYGYDY